MNTKPCYVSLFSGAGGLDIGLERAGLEPVSLCEIEKTFCETLAKNQGWTHCDGRHYLGNADIINADIREVGATDICKRTNLDLLVGGPPCQAFSSAGRQLSVLDPRGMLVNEFYRLVDALKPKMFLFENVRGLITARNTSGEPGGVIIELLNILEDIGYSCRAGLLNAADYGSHQRRVRCFILGSRRGIAPNFPEPEYQENPHLFGKRWRTLRDFLVEHSEQNADNFTFPTSALWEQLKDIAPGGGLKSRGRAEATRPGGHWGYRQGTFIADLDRPARTVTGSASQDWIYWNGVFRRLSFNEVKKLQGFPEDWIVSGTKSQQFKQIGNAVPAAFGVAIGRVIVAHLSRFPTSKPVRIGMPALFKGYIEYTKKDHERNKNYRTVHRHFGNGKV